MADMVECHKDPVAGAVEIVVVGAVQSNLYLVEMLEIPQKQYPRIQFEGLHPMET